MNHSNSSQLTQQERPKQEAVSHVASMIGRLLLIGPLAGISLFAFLSFLQQAWSFGWGQDGEHSLSAIVEVNPLFLIFFGLFGLLAITSVLSLRSNWKMLQLANELENNGQITQGTITALWRGTNQHGIETNYYYVAYQYQPPDGDFLGVRQKVSKRIYNLLQVGDTVTVHYLPRDPKYSRIIE